MFELFETRFPSCLSSWWKLFCTFFDSRFFMFGVLLPPWYGMVYAKLDWKFLSLWSNELSYCLLFWVIDTYRLAILVAVSPSCLFFYEPTSLNSPEYCFYIFSDDLKFLVKCDSEAYACISKFLVFTSFMRFLSKIFVPRIVLVFGLYVDMVIF